MTSKGRKFTVAEVAKCSGAAPVLGPALFVIGLVGSIAGGACGARDAGDLAYVEGSGGSGAAGGVTSGPGSGTGGGTGTGTGTATGTGTTTGTGTGTATGTGTGTATGTGTGGMGSTSTSGPPVLVTVTALPEGSAYLYWDKGSVASNWADPGLDDSGWAKGIAPLGYGDPHINTVVDFGPSAASKYITTWFRTAFDVKDAPSVISMTIELLRDDGALVFLNGVEVVRSNMPSGAVNADTMASEVVQGSDEMVRVGFSVDPAVLVEGTNHLAIEVHQSSENSSDLAIDAEVTLEQLVP